MRNTDDYLDTPVTDKKQYFKLFNGKLNHDLDKKTEGKKWKRKFLAFITGFLVTGMMLAGISGFVNHSNVSNTVKVAKVQQVEDSPKNQDMTALHALHEEIFQLQNFTFAALETVNPYDYSLGGEKQESVGRSVADPGLGNFTFNVDKAGSSVSTDIDYGNGQKAKLTLNSDGTITFNYPNGDIYTGQTEGNKKHGQGTYSWKNGGEYKGGWANDLYEGDGTYTASNGSSISGYFHEGNLVTKQEKEKYINITLDNGDKYEGFLNDEYKPHGQGTYQYSNGDKYSGNFENGAKSGQGTYTWQNGAVYIGNWEKNKMNGSGSYHYPSGGDYLRLDGQFADNKPTGICNCFTTETHYYYTTWKEGKCTEVKE